MLKEILTQVLNIKYYYVSEVISFSESEIRLRLKRSDNINAICSVCNHRHTKGHHSTDTIIVRDLSISGRKVFLEVVVETYRCMNCNKH